MIPRATFTHRVAVARCRYRALNNPATICAACFSLRGRPRPDESGKPAAQVNTMVALHTRHSSGCINAGIQLYQFFPMCGRKRNEQTTHG